MMVLEHEKLFGNLKKCAFFTNEVTFLGHIVTKNGIKMDEGKVEAIQSWQTPQSIHYAVSMGWLYRWFQTKF